MASAISERLERLRGRLILFAPIFLGIGIGVYFLLRTEPGVIGWAVLAGLAVGAAMAGWLIGRGTLPGFGLPFLAAAAVMTGLMLAGGRTSMVAAPVLDFRYYGPVEGRIVVIDRSQSDAVRLTLDQVRLDDVAPWKVPDRVRVSLHGQQGFVDPVPGMRIAVTSHLSGPEGPVEPGGFDFRRMAWFRSIGAVGYTTKPALALALPERALPIHRLRAAISAAVQAEIPGEAGAFAAAITTGDRSAMGQETVEALRASNLAHLLAISGLHMGLLVGFVFGTLRLGLALTPGVGVSMDVRKVAAVVALAAGAFYLAMSGGAVSTSRAFVMVAVMLVAILVGRRALTLRAVAVAALILLILKPESLVEAGFQMSFAATTALVFVFGALRDVQRGKLPKWARPVFAVVLSSLVAGLATAPFSAAIFNRVAHYGLIANVVSVPVMGTLVMPLAVLAALLAPLGLSWIALDLMRWPIEWILWVAKKVAALDGAVGHVITPPDAVMPMIALGGLAVILLRGAGRAAGAIAVVAALALWTQATRPDVLISPSGSLIGAMTAEGRALTKARGEGFAARSWLENDGDSTDQEGAAARMAQATDPQFDLPGLTLRLVSGRGAADRLEGACASEALVIFAAKPLDRYPEGCNMLDRAALARTGALAITLTADGPRVTSVAQVSGNRPWTRADQTKTRRTQPAASDLPLLIARQ
ncbi:ComEC/Rec2 family competence protein [Maritimibacter alexandrii]|uniref:ComEC/Rec2 family competence protein n=1 Tax=Maritimibacter alexandrii TaxID=2570355 RepID=UPI0011094DDB|nr:ComEC/Rec2 family competence protein [Maritimibacter alexandrii]